MSTLCSEVDEYAESVPSLNDENAHIYAGLISDAQCDFCDLDFYRNELGNLGLQQIMQAMQTNKSVKTLTISVGDPAASNCFEYVGQMLQKNRKLETLNIFVFKSGLEINPIIQALKNNNVLQHLQMRKCQITLPNEIELLQMLQNNRTLLSLEISQVFNRFRCHNDLLKRNAQYAWNLVHPQLLDFTIGLYGLNLPPYVLLEIFDFLPHMQHVNHFKKIQLIEGVVRSARKVVTNRM